MATFVITKYTNEIPTLVLNPDQDHWGRGYSGHIGKDGKCLLDYAITWAQHNGISGDTEKAFGDFFKYALRTYVGPDQDSAELWIRRVDSGCQVNDWEIPRPHHDGQYWSKDLNSGRDQFKVGTVLLGPGTLLWDVDSTDEETRKKAQHIVGVKQYEMAKELDIQQDYGEPMATGEWTAAQLDALNVPRPQAQVGECIRWVIGDDERAAIHPEPDMSDMPQGRIL